MRQGDKPVTRSELDDVERIYALRNEIGHELLRIIADDDKNPITLEDVLITFSVYVKIARWWIKEVEATTNPEFRKEKYDNANWDAAESADTLFLREIIRKVLVGDKSWEDLQKFADDQQPAAL